MGMPSGVGCLKMDTVEVREIESLKLEELEGLLSREGTRVFLDDLDNAGYTMVYGKSGVDIILKEDQSLRERGITLVHEAIHIIRMIPGNVSNETERRIDEKAKEFYDANSQLVNGWIEKFKKRYKS